MAPQTATTGFIDNPVRGIALKLISIAFVVIMQAFAKVAGQVDVGQVTFFRCFFALLPVMVYLLWRGDLRPAFKTSHPLKHLVWGSLAFLGMFLGFYALARLPLAEAIALGYAQPLMATALSAIFLGELVRRYRWIAGVVGFAGVFIIAWPNLTLLSGGLGAREALGAIAAIAGAGVYAVLALMSRDIIRTESAATIVIMASLTGTVLALLASLSGWTPLAYWQILMLVMVGICGGLFQVINAEAYRYAETSALAPFEYAALLFSVVLAYFVFQDVPPIYTIVGGLVIIGSGLYVIWWERQNMAEQTAGSEPL
jgi:drug/metabolite transporter (DMT)-like permease